MRARGGGSTDVGRLPDRAHVGERHRDAASREIDGQRQPDRACADNQHIVVVSLRHRLRRENRFRARASNPGAGETSSRRHREDA
jgi:hypothetical protein